MGAWCIRSGNERTATTGPCDEGEKEGGKWYRSKETGEEITQTEVQKPQRDLDPHLGFVPWPHHGLRLVVRPNPRVLVLILGVAARAATSALGAAASLAWS